MLSHLILGLDPAFGSCHRYDHFILQRGQLPVASILLSVELFGHQAILLFCIACAVSYVFSGYYGLYSSQKIMYDKLHPQYINTHSH